MTEKPKEVAKVPEDGPHVKGHKAVMKLRSEAEKDASLQAYLGASVKAKP